MGVGLSISRTIIEAHGGQIWTEPNPGGGAIFKFTLRALTKEDIGDAPPNSLVHVIDDDDAVRNSLEFLLRAAKIEVRTYDSATAFLKALPGGEPAVS